MRITIFGSGYVGLVSGACFADAGNRVLCVDIDAGKIERLQRGEVPIHEPGLEALIVRNARAGRLTFTTDAAAGIAHGEVILIAVGTPPDEDGSADLRHVLAVARTVGAHLDGYRIVVDKSTVPVGTADRVRTEIAKALAARGVDHPFDVVSNPEFLKEGAAITDFVKPDRVVIGTDSPRAIETLCALYDPFTRNRDRLIVMDQRSAELTKYAANAMLATRISFMNEMANLAEKLGADIEHVRNGIGSDPRIGYVFLYAGVGYGGSCFPKDIQALVRTAASVGMPTRILDAVESVNNHQKSLLAEKIKRRFGETLNGKKIAVWGLSFKPDTDDMREAPSLVLIAELIRCGASVIAYDPIAMNEARRMLGPESQLRYGDSPMAVLQGADALAIVTEWKEFRSPDFSAMRERLKTPIVFDGRNLYDPNELLSKGLEYHPIGRNSGRL